MRTVYVRFSDEVEWLVCYQSISEIFCKENNEQNCNFSIRLFCSNSRENHTSVECCSRKQRKSSELQHFGFSFKANIFYLSFQDLIIYFFEVF